MVTGHFSSEGDVLLYDGVCGLCSGAVQLVLRHDRRATLRFSALQSDFGRAALARHPEIQSVDSVVYLERLPTGERARVRSDAALRLATYLGGAWGLLAVFRVVPRPLRDFLYDGVARYRYRWFGKHDVCMIPAPEVRSRFLE
jgi:predicted DCC family thiol-disulfide oxidoreductase YuxK